MIQNYIKTAVRNLTKRRLISVINLTGLSVSLALFIMIGSYIQFETSYDDFHRNGDNIYLLTKDFNGSLIGTVNYPEGELLAKDYPQINRSVRMYKSDNSLTKSGELSFMENNFYFADKNFFEVFDFELLEGSKEAVFSQIDNVVITEETALRYFGTANAIGKIITVTEQFWNVTNDFIVSGIAKDIPLNSHIRFDFLTSFDAFDRLTGLNSSHQNPVWYWGWNAFQAYVELNPGTNLIEFEEGLDAHVQRYYHERDKEISKLSLTPLEAVYLRADVNNGHDIVGNPRTIKILSGIALFILIIACINFVNLTTARSSLYAREIGVKKVLGARRIQLFFQLITESTIIVYAAIILAVVLVEVGLPVFQNVIDQSIEVNLLSIPNLIKLSLLGAIVGLIAGFYPGIVMSSFKPLAALRGKAQQSEGKISVRKILVVFQFSVSIILVLGSMVIYKQLVHVSNKDLGFEHDELMYVEVPSGLTTGANGVLTAKYNAMQERLRQLSGIHEVTSIEDRPGVFIGGELVVPEGRTFEDPLSMSVMWVDEHFFETFNIPINGDLGTYASNRPVRYFVNEQAKEVLGWDDPIGKKIGVANRTGVTRQGLINGTIPDFNFESLHNPIKPMMIGLWPNHLSSGRWNLFIKSNTSDYNGLIAEVESIWKEYYPERPFNISFLGQNIEQQYKSQANLLKILPVLTGFAVFIACLGLFGLASFVVERRTKEVGIRKVLGASIQQIVGLISKDFMMLLIVANVMAWPAAYFYLQDWLGNFDYRITLGAGFFIGSGLLVIVVALFTVGMKVFKGAKSNLVDVLRTE